MLAFVCGVTYCKLLSNDVKSITGSSYNHMLCISYCYNNNNDDNKKVRKKYKDIVVMTRNALTAGTRQRRNSSLIFEPNWNTVGLS